MELDGDDADEDLFKEEDYGGDEAGLHDLVHYAPVPAGGVQDSTYET